LAHLVDAHLSCEMVQRWKPAREPYLYACDVLGVHPSDAWMVAAHSWDIGGAAAVGMRTGWLSRLEGVFDESFEQPDVWGADLFEVIEQLLS
jgi:2-haloacid dehalogenase